MNRFSTAISVQIVSAITICLVACVLHAAPITLKVGDPAPPLKAGQWIKGDPVKQFAAGKVYVIECWATWCGPCRESIPHVSELQQKYKDSVIVIGQDMWEHEDALVAPFVQQMADKMNYRVCLDDKSTDTEGTMASTWMAAAGQNGIPCAFIINQSGKITWIGHPMAMEPVLEKVVAGTWDMKAAIAAAEETARYKEIFERYSASVGANDVDAGNKAIDEMKAQFPQRVGDGADLKFTLLLRTGHYDQAYAMADSYYEHVKDNPAQLNETAWLIATDDSIKQRDLKLAERLATRAVELTHHDDASVIDTLARIRFDQGKVDDAIALENDALAKAPADTKGVISVSLDTYKKAKTSH